MSDNSGFYRAFEDIHRGSRELIQSRLAVYLPFVRSVLQLHPGASVTDVGCGRGEWLQLLGSEGFKVQGVDLDDGMLQACRALGLDVRNGDAVGFLQSLPDASQAVVSGFHIAEHLPFEVLHALVEQAHRVLLPGGLLILETPNAENLLVASSGFYMDPTHERPIPWQLLEFMAQYHGFARTRLLRLQEPAELAQRESLSLLDVLGGASPDYAIVAQKQAPAQAAVLLDAPFQQEHGLALDTLANRYDHKLKQDIHIASVAALQAERQSRQAQDYQQRAEQIFHDLNVRLAHAEVRNQQTEQRLSDQLDAMLASSSWRLTRPWRLAGGLARDILTPGRRALLGRIARALRLRPQRPVAAAAPPAEAGPAQDASTLSAAERRINEQLDAAQRGPETRD